LKTYTVVSAAINAMRHKPRRHKGFQTKIPLPQTNNSTLMCLQQRKRPVWGFWLATLSSRMLREECGPEQTPREEVRFAKGNDSCHSDDTEVFHDNTAENAKLKPQW
jgi:hypothetical protein